MSTLTIARSLRAASVALVHVACAEHEPVLARYGDMVVCGVCGAVLREETQGLGELDWLLACGFIDWDEYAESRDALLGHP